MLNVQCIVLTAKPFVYSVLCVYMYLILCVYCVPFVYFGFVVNRLSNHSKTKEYILYSHEQRRDLKKLRKGFYIVKTYDSTKIQYMRYSLFMIHGK